MLSGNYDNISVVYNHFDDSISQNQLAIFFIPKFGNKEVVSIVNLLVDLKLLKVENDLLIKSYRNISLKRLQSLFLNNLTSFHNFIDLSKILIYDSVIDKYRVTQKVPSTNFDYLLSIFVTLKLCEKDLNNYFYLDIPQKILFENASAGMSNERFEKILLQKKINGEIAERFVLNYELNRIRDNNKVQHVSITNVSAGYDITSVYSDTNNRPIFIEVKSFSCFQHFFWSENEIEKSRILGEDYYLYLIRIINKKPSLYRIINNPFNSIITNGEFEFKLHYNREIFF
jgi:hypothetical protein